MVCPNVRNWPVFGANPLTIDANRVWAPQQLFKLVYDPATGRAWAHWLDNSDEASIGKPISYGELVRLLALNLAHHQRLHVEITLDATLALPDTATPNAAQVELMTEGMINLIGMLGNVCSGLGEAKH